MSKDIIESNWTLAKEKIKQHWNKLTDDEIEQINGKYEELSGHIQKTYRYGKKRVEKEIAEFIKKNKLQ
ncbi:MAG: CsbD family protein [Oligoflexia bacterium]|nr:CsbD family protein [Oligoflexia bacterium]